MQEILSLKGKQIFEIFAPEIKKPDMHNSFIKLFLITFFAVFSFTAHAQQGVERILTLDEMFRLVESNSTSVQISRTALDQATEAVRVAKS